MNSNEAKLCQGKDIFERMNYLYQASRFVAESNQTVASYYGNIMISCAKKSVLRMEPDVKRTMCKSCHSPLIPGETARIRLLSKPVKAVQWTCLACKATRRIPSKKTNSLWIDEPESLVQTYDYAPENEKEFDTSDSIKTKPIQVPTEDACATNANIPQEERLKNLVIAERSES